MSITVFENEFKSTTTWWEKLLERKKIRPITKVDAFRDESVSTIFDEQKINDQLDYNETL
jgi:hypothetical protein